MSHEKSVSAIRILAVDAIENAKSGHPGLPLGAAPMAYELYAHHLRFNPKNPEFFNRDRFVLSAGHGSALMYSLLNVFGFDVTIDDIKRFRQAGSKTPGHPERGVTPGVDVSTGPLGQGIANAVGIAAAETMLAAKFNIDGFDIVDHYTYALCGEGCLMEGIANEAASLAGTWKLGKLIVLYDCNKITIEGSSDIAFDEDVAKRHEAQGWQVIRVADGNDIWEIGKAIESAKAEKNKPSLIIVTTRIGYASPLEGCAACHGAPLGAEKAAATRSKLGWDYPPFTVPDEVYKDCAAAGQRGAAAEEKWNDLLKEYGKKYPELKAEFDKALAGLPKINFDKYYAEMSEKTLAGRKASGIMLNAIADECGLFLGGSADLGPSNQTILDGKGDYSAADRAGRNMHFGIREHAMAAIANGMALHGAILPYCATFFAFSDYMKNAIRMSALMELPVIYVFTHDSIAVGEDGPTHEPIEHLAGLRAMPVLKVFRPCDAAETVAAYESALSENRPTAIVAAKQDLKPIKGTGRNALKGGYTVLDTPSPDAIIMASGSEVATALDAAGILGGQGIRVRVVSMPCMSVFDEQTQEYRESVLPPSVRARVAVEAAASMSWGKYVGLDGEYVCVDAFGESARAADLFAKFKITAEEIVKKVKSVVKK